MAISTRTTYDVDIADVEYLRHGDKPLLARLFKPRGSGPFPIMVELHGGAWVRGSRVNGNAANEALAKKCTASSVDREMRKGKDPSDHAPIWAEFDL